MTSFSFRLLISREAVNKGEEVNRSITECLHELQPEPQQHYVILAIPSWVRRWEENSLHVNEGLSGETWGGRTPCLLFCPRWYRADYLGVDFGGGHLRCGSVNSVASINNHIGFLNLRPQFVRDVSTQAGGEGRGWEGRGVETDEANF